MSITGRSIMKIIAIGLLVFLFLAVSPVGVLTAQGSGRCYVDQNASGGNDGSSWGDAYQELQSALANSACSEIWVAAGIYYPTQGTDRSISFTLRNDLAIYGGFAATESNLSERDIDSNLTTLSGDIGVIGDDSDNSYNDSTAKTSTLTTKYTNPTSKPINV